MPFAIAGRSPASLVGSLFLISESFIRVILPLSLPGRLRGLAAHVHPGDRRLRQRRAARQPADADDRQRHPEPVPRERTTTRRRRRCSFILMAGILVAVLVYARLLGHRRADERRLMAAADVAPPRARRSRAWQRFVDRTLLLRLHGLARSSYLMLPVAVMVLFSFQRPALAEQPAVARLLARRLAQPVRRARAVRRRRGQRRWSRCSRRSSRRSSAR